MEGDDRTFGVTFSTEGVKRLRDQVKEKLKVFMGDYTDDTLVEYVLVLLKNGRDKNEAKNELNVFLGDDSDSFVFWLWDHLGSNLNLYVQPQEFPLDEALKTNYIVGNQSGRTEVQFTTSKAEKGSSNSTPKNYRIQQQIGLVRDEDENESPVPKKSSADNIFGQEGCRERVDHTKPSRSPSPTNQKKRRRMEVREPRKREVSQPIVSAPRRLLQSAVRDAVGTSKPHNSTEKPLLKRLRSVVSTSTENSFFEEHPQRTRKSARLSTDMSAAIKAMSDAVKDVIETRPSRNVFDRLSHATNASSNIINHQAEYTDRAEESYFVDERENFISTYYNNDSNTLQEDNMSSLDNKIVYASNLGLVEDGDDVDVMEGGAGMYWSGVSVENQLENPEFQYQTAHYDEKRLHRAVKPLDRPTSVPNTCFPIASSVKIALRPPQFREAREESELENVKLSAKSRQWLTNEKNNSIASSNGNAKLGIEHTHDPHKTLTGIGLNSPAPPTEDADSRTVFVSNVHFAATKDSLSRHFNKSGEVLKVNILSDPSTGQPKGSACIEFMRKEAAEHALSLNGTSFMSRILKIVRRTSAQAESASVINWPRIARASLFTAPSFGRVPFPRGIPSLYRPRAAIKPGARSFQWKRELTATETVNFGSNSTILPSTPRSLTYVRTEPKTSGSSSIV